ncbi:MAG: cytosine deaminase [Rhodobacteraceae bacterium]|nr:cytosine deaminase [Paracoccaceae bacterium]
MEQRIAVEAALLGADYDTSGPVEITVSDGVITRIAPTDTAPRLLAMPPLADAHNHGRAMSTTSLGCGGRPLELWLPALAMIPSVDPYLTYATSFARSLQGGAGAVMVHLTRPMGPMPLPEEAKIMARAAADVGISIAFAVSMRDRNPLVYGDGAPILDALPPRTRALAEATWLKPLAPVEDQMALVEAVADAVADQPHVDVQYGPNGVQWCSDALLSAIARRSGETGRRVHMHLLETQPQRDWADASFPDGIVGHLQTLGLLSDRLTLAHCVWARPDELARIAATGARIAVNVSSNLHLFSGIAPVPQMMEAGVPVAMGLDGCALDEDDDGLRELRLFHLLNHARGFGAGGMTPTRALTAACRTGRAALGLGAGGILAEGMAADLMLLDLAALDRDAVMAVDPRAYLFTRAARSHIAAIYLGGCRVLDQGRPTGVDVDALQTDLRAALRRALPGRADLIAAWPDIEPHIAAHYGGCC